jgi:tRNA U34 2-thiouridine synthase MnmA/TrmU
MNKKAIGLLSGGLDSSLAVRIMLDIGIEVIALNFLSPFCTCTRKGAGCKSEALKASKQFGIKSKTLFLGEKYLEMVKSPKYGYGSNMNPCIDCRIMMFKDAKQFMIDENASFIFTGEVLGQRPMSQRRDTMSIIERDSGLKGLIVRPLSAQFLKPTLPEINGIINRNRLLKIRGRSRKHQMALAEEKGIYDYPCASGGCLLTDYHFVKRLKDLYRFQNPIGLNDARLLRVGRHLRINDRCKIIVGRNKEENEKLEKLAQAGDYVFRSTEHKGPLVVVKGKIDNGAMETISAITAHYSKAPKLTKIPVEVYKYPDYKLPPQEACSLDEKAVKNLLL